MVLRYRRSSLPRTGTNFQSGLNKPHVLNLFPREAYGAQEEKGAGPDETIMLMGLT